MTTTGLQLRSLVKNDNTLELSLVEMEFPQPGPDEVLVRVEGPAADPGSWGVDNTGLLDAGAGYCLPAR